ncbi:MAG TPA: TAXI family TRAP transporter solute-binding subunit [Stellaceae bacterium]|jgi:TRAP transporter TAXI family solute receptor|nr:TAXI family TRAP transporter solute-binding subunit [Stellaceae bacterium]
MVCASLLLAALGAAAAAQETRFFRIGTAATGGSFFEIGGVIASAISSPGQAPRCGHGGGCGVPGLVAVAQATQGSLENIRLVNAGQLESGFAQADLAGWAYTGSELFRKDGPMPQLRAIGSLFPETLQVVVRADSAIRGIRGLKGRRVALGGLGSGTVANARVLLAAAGLRDTDVQRKYLRPSQAVEGLRAGTLDALVIAGGAPVPAVQQLATTTPIRLLPIDGAIAEALLREFAFYRRATIPPDTYPGVADETETVGFHALWLVSAAADPALIYAITKALWNEATGRLLAGLDPLGRSVRLEDALVGLSVPLHPGAERFYREAGMALDDLPQAAPESPQTHVEDGSR